jgi:hypothetical protein
MPFRAHGEFTTDGGGCRTKRAWVISLQNTS